jgi:hypothetical protein
LTFGRLGFDNAENSESRQREPPETCCDDFQNGTTRHSPSRAFASLLGDAEMIRRKYPVSSIANGSFRSP